MGENKNFTTNRTPLKIILGVFGVDRPRRGTNSSSTLLRQTGPSTQPPSTRGRAGELKKSSPGTLDSG